MWGGITIICRQNEFLRICSWCCNCCSVTKSCPTFCDPIGCSTPGSTVLTISQSLLIFTSTELVTLSIQSSAVLEFVLELQLQHQYYQEYSGLISFRTDWFDLLVLQFSCLKNPMNSTKRQKDMTSQDELPGWKVSDMLLMKNGEQLLIAPDRMKW